MLLDKGAKMTLDDGRTLLQAWAGTGQTQGERKEGWAKAAALSSADAAIKTRKEKFNRMVLSPV